MSKPRVLLTSAIHPTQLPRLAEHCEPVLAPDTAAATFARLADDVHGILVRNQLPPDICDHAPLLRAIVRHGVGLDMIPVTAATARGIPVANLPGSNSRAVAEYCLAALFHLRRGLAPMDARLRTQGWAAARPMSENTAELAGSTLGIVGVGAIGALLAAAALGLGMRVLGLTRRPESLPAGVVAATQERLFAQADAVALCCPLNEQTRGLVSAAVIATMKPGAVLINVSRGPVMDTAAVVAALREGRLGGAAMDVHDQQPLTGAEPVFDCPNLLLTPHVGGVSSTSSLAMSTGAVDTMLALLRGERPANVVNPEVFR